MIVPSKLKITIAPEPNQTAIAVLKTQNHDRPSQNPKPRSPIYKNQTTITFSKPFSR